MPISNPLYRLRCIVPFLFLLVGSSLHGQTASEQQEIPNTQPLTIPMTPPEDALAMIELPAGFNATLAASEPDVHQPIAATFDYRGRLWVVECYTYTDRAKGFDAKLNDRVVIFEDTNQDGVFDSRKIFWDKGKALSGIELGFGGVWLTSAPNLIFIPDSDRDDKPDGEPEIMLDGFALSKIRHNVVNGLRWGPDGWLYGHLFHVVPGARYSRMYGSHFNPHTYQVIPQTADHVHWDTDNEKWNDAKKSELSDSTDKAGGGHAHCGMMIYQGDNWPEEFHNKIFTANFHGRRLNSEIIKRHGNGYFAVHGPDYFETADPWFRGIELLTAPDGGVFVLDWSDIGECHERDGIHRTSGRIFKLVYGDHLSGDLASGRRRSQSCRS